MPLPLSPPAMTVEGPRARCAQIDGAFRPYQVAIAGAACGLIVDVEDCGTYRRVFIYPSPSQGPGMLYYYSSVDVLVAVVQREDAFGDTCIAGPTTFVEPCDESCTLTDAGSATGCSDAGDAGHDGGG